MAKQKKRDDGLFQKNIFLGIDPDTGKRKYKTIYAKSAAELERKCAPVLADLEKGTYADDKGMTFGKWADKWLALYKTGVSAGTRRNYERALRKLAQISTIRLRDLRKSNIQEVLAANDGYYETQRLIMITAKQILNAAVEDGLIYRNVCNGLKLTHPVVQSEKRALTDLEKKAIRSCDFTPSESIFIKILFMTGARRGEALALMKSDINFATGTISINKSLEFVNNSQPAIKPPKTQTSIRTVPMPDDLSGALKEYLPTIPGLYLFYGRDGAPVCFSNYRRFWDRIIDKINIQMGGNKNLILTRGLTPHTFRHNYATTLYYSGIGAKEAQKLLGHSSIRITLELYTHLSGTDEQVQNKLKSLSI